MQSLVYIRALAFKPHKFTSFLKPGRPTSFPTTRRLYSSVSPSRKQMQASKITFTTPIAGEQATILKNNNTKKSKLKEITKKYGAVGIFVYIGVGCLDLGVTLGLIQLAGLERVKAIERSVLEGLHTMGGYLGLSQKAEEETEELSLKEMVTTEDGKPSFASIFILAYTIHKTLMLPVRIGVTAAITPAVVRKLHQMGWARYFPRLLAASVPKKP